MSSNEMRSFDGDKLTKQRLGLLKLDALTGLYNAIAEKPVKSFRDKPTAIERVWELGKPITLKLAKDKSKKDGGRKKHYGNDTVISVVHPFPADKRQKVNDQVTKTYQLYQMLKVGMTFGEAAAKGAEKEITRGHLNHMADIGVFELKDAK